MTWFNFGACAKCGGDLVNDDGDWACLQCGTYYYHGLYQPAQSPTLHGLSPRTAAVLAWLAERQRQDPGGGGEAKAS